MEPPEGDEPDTRERIMRATYRALCDHGYADLTTSAIAERSGLSTAALHYHYESKAALLEAFLEFLLEWFRAEMAAIGAETPAGRLDALLTTAFAPPGDDEGEFRTALLEIQAQAPYEPVFRELLTEFDRFLHEEVHTALADGVATGTFRDDVDPDAVAEFVLTVVSGAQTRRVAVGADPETAERTLRSYLDSLRVDTGGSGSFLGDDEADLGDDEAEGSS